MPLFLEQIANNIAVLESIQKHGLGPRRDISIGGIFDASLSHLLCYNFFNVNPATLENNLTAICYEDISGLWSIGIEGVGANPRNLDIQAINDGLQNSIVFLFAAKPTVNAPKTLTKPLQNFMLTSRTPLSHACCEHRTYKPIPFQEILAILVPRHLMPLMKKQFPEKHLIPVDDHKLVVVEVPWMATKNFYSQSLSDINADMLAGNNYLTAPQDLVGPDYKQGLRDFIKLYPAVKDIGIHLTRLYTPALCVEPNLTVTDAASNVVTIAKQISAEQKQQLGLVTLLLKFLKPEPFEFLSTHPHMTLIKHSLVPNSYYLYCDAKYKPLLNLVVNDLPRLKRNASLIETAYNNFSQNRLNIFFKSQNDKIIALKKDMQELLHADDFACIAQKALAAQAVNEKITEVKARVDQNGVIVASARLCK